MNAEHNEMKEEILKIIRELEDSLMSSCDPYLWDAIRKIETRIKATNKGLNELALGYYQKNVEFLEESYDFYLGDAVHDMAKRLTFFKVTIKDGIMTFEDGTTIDLSKDIFDEE